MFVFFSFSLNITLPLFPLQMIAYERHFWAPCSFTLLCTVLRILCNILLVVFRYCVCKCNTYLMEKKMQDSIPSRNHRCWINQVQFTHHCSDISNWTRWCFPGRSRTHRDDLPSCSCRWPCRSLPPGWCLHKNGPFPSQSKKINV